ncbi:MAG: winged helix-turn-helix transcriptional regulator [Nitrospirota bacterium]
MNNSPDNNFSKDDEVTLRLLNEISQDSTLTQRKLSTRLGVALGLTNALIKRLVKKGYIKITTIPKNRIKYLITPKGIKEKTRLTYEYTICSIHYLKNARENIVKSLSVLSKKGVNDVLFCGDGEMAELVHISLGECNLNLVGVIDDKKVGKSFHGHKISDFDDIDKLKFDAIIITSDRDEEGYYNKLIEQHVDQDKIWRIQWGWK